MLVVLALSSAAIFGKPATRPALARRQLGIPTVAFAGKTIGDALNDFQSRSQQLLQEGQGRGNALIYSAGDQMQLLVENLRLAASDIETKTMNDAQGQLLVPVFQQMNQLILKADQDLDRVASLVELENLNIIDILNKVPLMRHTDFYVSSVDSAVWVDQPQDYTMTVRGIGIGSSTDDVTIEKSVSVAPIRDDGKPGEFKNLDAGSVLDTGSVTTLDSHTVSVRVPRSWVADAFKADKPAGFAVRLSSTLTKTREILNVPVNKIPVVRRVLKPTKKKYEITFNVMLLPSNAATITVSQLVVQKGLDGKSVFANRIPYTTPAHTGNGKNGAPVDNFYSRWKCADDEVITTVEYVPPADDSGRFLYMVHPHEPRHEYDADYAVAPDRKSVEVWRRCEIGNASFSYDVYVQHMVTRHVPLETPKTVSLKYEVPVTIDLDASNDNGNYSLVGTTSLKERLFANSAPQSSGQLEIHLLKPGDHYQLSIVLHKPAH